MNTLSSKKSPFSHFLVFRKYFNLTNRGTPIWQSYQNVYNNFMTQTWFCCQLKCNGDSELSVGNCWSNGDGGLSLHLPSTVLLTNSTYYIWHFVLWWTGGVWEWLVPYIIDYGKIWLFEIVNLRLLFQKNGYSKSFWNIF